MKLSKEGKRSMREIRAYRIMVCRWLPGLHTRWMMAARAALRGRAR